MALMTKETSKRVPMYQSALTRDVLMEYLGTMTERLIQRLEETLAAQEGDRSEDDQA